MAKIFKYPNLYVKSPVIQICCLSIMMCFFSYGILMSKMFLVMIISVISDLILFYVIITCYCLLKERLRNPLSFLIDESTLTITYHNGDIVIIPWSDIQSIQMLTHSIRFDDAMGEDFIRIELKNKSNYIEASSYLRNYKAFKNELYEKTRGRIPITEVSGHWKQPPFI